MTEIGPPLSTSDHNSVLAVVNLPISSIHLGSKIVYDLRERFVTNFVNCIRDFNWDIFIDGDFDVNGKCTIFHDFILNCFNEFIPKRIVPISPKDKPWITPYIKNLIHDRWSAYRCRNFQRYNTLSSLIKTKIIEAKRRWATKNSNASELWSKIHTVAGSSSVNPISHLLDNFENDNIAANAINDYFTSVFVESNDIAHFNDNFIPWDIEITADTVKRAILQHSLRKSPGSDCLPIFLYHCVSDIISAPLAHIFKLSVQSHVFPDCWKHPHAIPIPKCKKPSMSDVRPISLLNFCGKLFERIIYDSIKDELHSLYGIHQFGFRKNSSTTTALIRLHDHITSHLDNLSVSGIQLFVLDYSKAFDKLRFDVIVRSLVNSNLPYPFVKWICSYLTNRTQLTRVNNTLSNAASINSGVPQGSILGPALFNIVLGLLKPISTSTCMVKFADDNTMSIPVFYSTNNVIPELNNVINFSDENGLVLNYLKCHYIFISFKPNCNSIQVENITEKNSVKILGVHFTNDLKWDLHFSHIVKKANQRFYALRILRPYLNNNDLKTAYYAFIRSLLEYCSPLFVGINQKLCVILERVQTRFHNLLCNINCNCNSLVCLKTRRSNASVKLFTRISADSEHLLYNLIPKCHHKLYCMPFCRTTRRLTSFIPTVTLLVNSPSLLFQILILIINKRLQ